MITDSDMCALEVIFGQAESWDDLRQVQDLLTQAALRLEVAAQPWTVGSSPAAQAEALAEAQESERRQDLGIEEGPL